MINKENEELAKILIWKKNNADIWDVICDNGVTIGASEAITILEGLRKEGMYQLLVLFLEKLDHDQDFNNAINRGIMNIIKKINPDISVFDECIQEIKEEIKQKKIIRPLVM